MKNLEGHDGNGMDTDGVNGVGVAFKDAVFSLR